MKYIKYILYLVTSVVTFSACSDAITTTNPVTTEEGTPAHVSFGLDIMPMGYGGGTDSTDAPTRAGYAENGTVDETTIKNLWVLQYAYNADEKAYFLQRNGAQQITDYTKADYMSTGTKTIELSGSGSNKDSIVFLANYPESHINRGSMASAFSGGSRLSTLKDAVYQSITTEDDFVYTDAEGNKYLPMVGSWEGTVTDGMTLSDDIQLYRPEARIDVTITNKTSSSSQQVTIDDAILCSVPGGHTYYPSYVPKGGNIGTSNLMNMGVVNYPTVSVNLKPTDEKTWNYTWYMPANKQGTRNNHTETIKNIFAPGYATYLLVEGHYSKGTEEVPITYTFYLGANMTNDFNILNNYQYVYNITIKDRGDYGYDFRVEDFGDVDFDDIANCYVLYPTQSPKTFARTFTIPINRINTFWKDYLHDDSHALKSGDTWVADILWTDFNNSDNTISLSTYSGAIDNESDLGRFGVTVKANAKGNAVVGVRKDDSTEYLWSWHLWITDYRPDKAAYKIASDNTFVYPIGGGNAQRYIDSESSMAFWANGGVYAGKFIMDRNLGALSSSDAGLYYQYGRKDPFPSGTSYKGGSSSRSNSYDSYVNNAATIADGVKNPTSYYGNENTMWMPDTEWFNVNYLWNDPRATVENHRKSIFDPCPPGYKLPERDMSSTGTNKGRTLWSDFKNSDAKTDAVFYWPSSATTEPEEKNQIIYQYSGRLNSGGQKTDNDYRFFIVEANNNGNRPYVIRGTAAGNSGSGITETAENHNSSAYTVRCVTE